MDLFQRGRTLEALSQFGRSNASAHDDSNDVARLLSSFHDDSGFPSDCSSPEDCETGHIVADMIPDMRIAGWMEGGWMGGIRKTNSGWMDGQERAKGM